MIQTELDLIPLADLASRYNVGRSVIYNRLGALNIHPTRFGKRAFVKADEFDLLNALDEHLKRGGITSEFTAQLFGAQPLDTPHGGIAECTEDLNRTLMGLLCRQMATHASSLINPLWDLDALEKAHLNGWCLPTSRLAQLVGLHPKSLVRHQKLTRYGFVFTKIGRQGSKQVFWVVDKICSNP